MPLLQTSGLRWRKQFPYFAITLHVPMARNQDVAHLSGWSAALALQGKKRPPRRRRQAGIQSLETGIVLLRALVAAAAPMKLKDVAAAARMSPSKAHRYMVSLCRTGLVAQEAADAEYRLGPYALEMALACLNSLRPVKLASAALEAVSREAGLTVAIAAWGNHGPTIVRIEESTHAVSMNVRAGTVVPVTRSAAGLVLAAFLPRHVVESRLVEELPRAADRKSLERCLDRIRASGVASVAQKLVPGTDALAVPIFDHRSAVALALLAVGASGTFSLSPEGPVASTLKRHAEGLSRQLGCPRAE
jgi:DNA-binding IclR family transcriptional regulator